MKKYFLSLGLIAAAAFTLTNCTKEIDQPDQAPESAGFPFEITASTAVTKTVAGDEYATNWANNDALSVFHAEAGSTEYGANDKFTITAENLASNRFTGNLTEKLDGNKSYDWYVFYPYNNKYDTPASTSSGVVYLGSRYNEVQTQTGYDNYSHLAGSNFPLYGKSKDTPSSDTPHFGMSHLTSALKLTVTNTTSEPLTINQVSFTAPEDIIGGYYISIAGEEVIYTPNGDYVNKTATLNVKEGTSLDNGESATFYIGFKPFAAKSGAVLKMSVNGYEKELTLTKDVTFAAGHIKAMTFDYNQVMELKTVSLPWKEDFGTIETPSDLSNYTLVNASVKTDAGYAGGLLPELMISKDGYLSVNVDLEGKSGDMTLSFKSNYADKWSITTSTNNVEITKPETTGIYYINVPEDTDVLQLTLTNTRSNNNRIDDISLSVGKKFAQTLEFDENEVSVTFGDVFTRPVLSGAVTTVTYSSSVPTVATVNSSTGEVSIVGAGTTVITATAAETNEYFGASASYTLNVSTGNEKYYVKVTEAPEDWSGKYLLVCESKGMVFSGFSTTNTVYGLGEEVIITGEGILSDATTDAYQLIISAATTTSEAYVIKFGDKFFNWSSGNSLTGGDADNQNTNWNLSIEEGNTIIVNVSDNTRKLRWNPSSPRFACYTSGQTAVQLYKFKED